MKSQSLFSWKNKIKYFKMLSAEMFNQHATPEVYRAQLFKTNYVIS